MATISVPMEKGETMEVKKRLVELQLQADIADNVSENTTRHREFIADFMIANGVTITPAVPGPSDDDHNIMELCFRNGEAHMKDKIIARLMEHKTKVKGVCHAHVVEIIKMVEGL